MQNNCTQNNCTQKNYCNDPKPSCPLAEHDCTKPLDHCMGHEKDKFTKEKAVAMAYVPWQKEPDIYEDLEKAYCAGTVFPELDKHFCGKR